jgi:hypothetical protein
MFVMRARFAVSAYVTHGVFPNFSWMKFKADTGGGSVTGGYIYQEMLGALNADTMPHVHV